MATTIKGTVGDDTLLGSAGNDVFYASGGTDRVWGGTGGVDRLVLTGRLSDYSFRDNGDGTFVLGDLRGNAPDGVVTARDIDELQFSDGLRSLSQVRADAINYVSGSAGNDTLLGTAGRDEISGGAGDDRIWGSSGSDTAVYSGKLSDYKIAANADGTFTVTDLRGGIGDGTDIVRDIEQFRFSDGATTLLQFTTASNVAAVSVVQGTSGNDNLLGISGNDVLFGKGGDDHIWGGSAGTDTAVYGGKSTDYAIKATGTGSYIVTDLRGGANDGADTVRDIEQFRFADKTVSLEAFAASNSALNVINGTAANNIVLGTAGNDVISARGGNDRIWGGKSGDDIALFSGKSTDYVITDNGNGSYTFVDTRAGSPDGTDVVRDIETFRFADTSKGIAEILSGNQNLVTTRAGGSGDDLLSGANTNSLFGAHTNDVLTGNQGNDVLRGGSGNDLLIGDWTGSAPPVNGTSLASGPPMTTATDLGNFEIKVETTGKVTFLGESAGFQNALGCYRIAADGTIQDVKVLFANASLTGSGGSLISGQSSVDVALHPGDHLGFFVVSNGYGQKGMPAILADTTGSFKMVGPNGTTGNINSTQPLKLVHVSSDGISVDVNSQYGTSIFHSVPGANNGLNADHFVHVTGVSQLADGSVKLGFEDLWGGGDKDFDDCVFALKVGAANIALLGQDSSLPGAGGDQLHGGLGADTLIGGAGNDTLEGGLSADQILGGDGFDTADYSRAATSVVVDLVAGGSAGEALGDTYSGVEQVDGSGFADTIRGSMGGDVLNGRDGADVLMGAAGNDVLRGGAGADTIDGGDGFDTATYFDAATGVTVDLGSGMGGNGVADGDRLMGIERVQGSNVGGDHLTGSAGNDELQGYGGDDTLVGAAGNDVLAGGDGADLLSGGDGADYLSGGAGRDILNGDSGDDMLVAGNGAGYAGDLIDGGGGFDTIDYSAALSGILIDLAAGRGGSQPTEFDSLSSVEAGIGSRFADTLWGDAGANRFQAGDGNDAIRGGDGNDLLLGEAGDDVIFGDAGDDYISGGAGYDRAVFEDDIAAYAIDRLNDGSYRVSHAGGSGSDDTDVVSATVEQLVFRDCAFDLSSGAINNSVTAYDFLFHA